MPKWWALLALAPLLWPPALAAEEAGAAAGTPPPESGVAADLRDTQENETEHRAAAADARARAAAATAEAARLERERAAAASRERSAEEESAAAMQRLAALQARAAEAETRRQATAAALQRLLPLAVRLSLYPTETLLAAPAAPEAAIGDVLVVRGLAREIAAEAASLQRETATVAALGAETEAARSRLASDVAAQTALAATLDQRIGAAQETARAEADAAGAAAREAAADAAHAADLRSALARLAADRDAARKRARAAAAALTRRHADAAASRAAREQAALLATPSGPGPGPPRRALIAPVAGAVIGHFGAQGEAGPAQGMSFQPPPAARVVSPCAGRAVFAGPFRSYGVIVIVDCGRGYDFVLAGLARLTLEVGQALHPGDPVGEMAHDDGPPHLLYVELRHHGEAVDPAPWLHTDGGSHGG